MVRTHGPTMVAPPTHVQVDTLLAATLDKKKILSHPSNASPTRHLLLATVAITSKTQLGISDQKKTKTFWAL